MEQEIAINKIITTIKIDATIPEEYHNQIKYYLSLIYVVGWESKIHEFNGCQHPIVQLNANKKPIKTFDSIIQAKNALECSKNTILNTLILHRKTRK